MEGYNIFRKDRSSHGGGLATFIRHGIEFSEVTYAVDNLTESQFFVLSGLQIGNIYVPPNSGEKFAFLEKFQAKSLIMGDFNAHHQTWSSTTNRLGDFLGKAVDDNNMVLLNSENPTRLNLASTAVNRWSLLDLVIASTDMAYRCQTRGTEDFLGSDHCIILTEVDCNISISQNWVPKWQFKRANWESFRCSVIQALTNIQNDLSGVDRLNADLTAILTDAAKLSIPFSSYRDCRKNPVPWWNSACQKGTRRKKAAYKKMKRTFAAHDIITFKRTRAECRRTILEAKRTCWRKFCDSLGKSDDLSKMWRMAQSFCGGQRSPYIPSITLGEKSATNNLTKANLLATVFCKTSKTENYSKSFIKRKTNYETYPVPFDLESSDPINNMFSIQELRKAIHSKNNSATGIDEVSYAMLKHLPDRALVSILHLFNSSWCQGEVPQSWRQSIVVPILKQGKPSKSATSYRPIALTSHLSKTLETMIVNRMKWFLERHRIFSPSQSGFRSQRSTLDHILALHDDAAKAVSNQRFFVAIFLDFERAFDMVWRYGLLSKPFGLGIRGRLLRNWLRSFLCNRRARVRLCSYVSDWYDVENELVQGIVLSLVLFAICIDGLPGNLTSKTTLYADDRALWESGTNVEQIRQSLQSDLNTISLWL